MEIWQILLAAALTCAAGVFGFWVRPYVRPSERLSDREAQRRLEELDEEEARAAAREEAQQDQDQLLGDQLHDLELIRRAIIAEIGAQGRGSIGFQFGRGARPGDPETRAVYWLDGDELRVQAKWSRNDTEWVWEEGMIPVTRSNRKQAKEVTRKPDSVAEAYSRFRFERLLVSKHPDEELRCPEPDWSGG